MTANINGVSSSHAMSGSLADSVAASRAKMISLVVEARLFQTPKNGLQTKGLLPLPLREKDKAHARDVRTMLGELLGAKGFLTTRLRELVCSYFSDDELGALAIYVNMPREINITDESILRTYLAPGVGAYVSSCKPILKAVYESTPRRISQQQYGSAFPINPELLAYAMQLARNETVLEIAGATGENSAALAFSGAERVYLNDIGEEEVQNFEQIREALTKAIPSVGKKLESIHGDCFDLLKLKPELANKVGLVLCRNLIHFFNDKKQAEFFALLKKMLKPGGRAIFTVNSVYFDSPQRKLNEQYPDATSFATTIGLICDYRTGTSPVARFYFETAPCPPDQVSLDFVATYLQQREWGALWVHDREAFNKLDKALQPKIQKALKPYEPRLEDIPAGSVKVLTNTVRAYSTKTLPALLASQGFAVEATFVTSYDGHLVNDETLSVVPTASADRSNPKSPQLVSVVVRYVGEALKDSVKA